jgi:hypothetical protein
MAQERHTTKEKDAMKAGIISLAVSALFFIGVFYYSTHVSHDTYSSKAIEKVNEVLGTSTEVIPTYPPLDRDAYDAKLLLLANRPPVATSTATTTATSTHHYLWPVKAVYPLDGAILPFNRIVAYYGNFYSTKMGVLGEYPA